MAPGHRLSPLATRLAGMFLVVAVGAVMLLGGLMLVATSRDVGELTHQQQDTTALEVARAVAAAYGAAGGWSGADLGTPRALATLSQGTVTIFDAAGNPMNGALVATPDERVVREDVVVNRKKVGEVAMAFTAEGSAAERNLRHALVQSILVGAALTLLLALGTAVLVARRIIRPVHDLTAAARALEHGDRTARVGDLRAPGELAVLGRAFDHMADTLAAQDDLRRAVVADVAHELRTPLTILQGTLEAMADGVIEATPEKLGSVRDEVLKLAGVVVDLEVLAATDATGLALQRQPLDLAAAVQGAAASLDLQFKAADLALVTSYQPVPVNGDPLRLHQLATNLLTNALKFTPAGGAVRVTVEPDGGPGAAPASARLVVTDTGPGIPPEDLDHVFDRFWRGPKARSVSGSGIGLTVVRNIAQAHGGTVTITSGSQPAGPAAGASVASGTEPGRGPGTTVCVVLPAIPTA